MPYEVIDNPLDQLVAPLKLEVFGALRTNGVQLVGQIVYIDNLLISYKPIYTCLRVNQVCIFFGELTAEGIGVSYEHPSILNHAIKAGGAWKKRHGNRLPFPEAHLINRQSWLDYVLFKTPLRTAETLENT